MICNLFPNAHDALTGLTNRLIALMNEDKTAPFHLALSGGETAQVLFTLWRDAYKTDINWSRIRFYWVDERCVDPQSNESNFNHANALLFTPLAIPASHIHRIMAEGDPEAEALRYSDLVKKQVPLLDGMPSFDCIILGVGTDLHTASIFPDSMQLLADERCYALSVHPESKQERITMTGTLILTGKMLLVPVLGQSKKEVVKTLLSEASCSITPAYHILWRALNAVLFTDCKL